jgi:hypothetical protein
VGTAGLSQGALAEETAKRTLRELKQDTSLYLSTPLIEHAIELVESDMRVGRPPSDVDRFRDVSSEVAFVG